MPVTTRVIKDRGEEELKRLQTVLREELLFRVGITAASGTGAHAGGSGLTVVEVAALSELGVGNPRRPFVSGWFDSNRGAISRLLLKESQQVYLGKKSIGNVGKKLGLRFERQMKSQMRFVPPPLAASTVRKKGNSLTLVDTAQVRAAITHEFEVKRRGFSR